MPTVLHPLARWLRLALTCLALAVTHAPASAPPEAQSVGVMVREGHLAATRGATAEVAAPSRRVSEQIRLQGRTAPRVRVMAERSPGPPRRLFLVHRALLR